MAGTLHRLFGRLKGTAEPEVAAVYRISLAAFIIVSLLVVRESWLDQYGQHGLIRWAITRASLPSVLPHIGDLAVLLAPLHISPDQTVYLVIGAYFLSLLMLLVGWHTRIAAIVAWCLHFLLMYAGGGMIYGMDIFTHIALLYAVLMPCGARWSIDSWGKTGIVNMFALSGLGRTLLRLHLLIIYTSSGIEKAMGAQWWNGEAIWRSLMLPAFHHFSLEWLAWHPWITVLAGWGTMAIEIGCSAVLVPALRRTWLIAVVFMHLGIGLFLGMWLFGTVMIILNFGAFACREDLLYLGRIKSPLLQSVSRTFPRGDPEVSEIAERLIDG